mmetsp:Transcript_66139/g.123421  ORF Transcript_66139/g.123421 Transcript_66139/m.123421 type:complete len:201 (-) Transcript_66139:1423-2025(-)
MPASSVASIKDLPSTTKPARDNASVQRTASFRRISCNKFVSCENMSDKVSTAAASSCPSAAEEDELAKAFTDPAPEGLLFISFVKEPKPRDNLCKRLIESLPLVPYKNDFNALLMRGFSSVTRRRAMYGKRPSRTAKFPSTCKPSPSSVPKALKTKMKYGGTRSGYSLAISSNSSASTPNLDFWFCSFSTFSGLKLFPSP